MIRGLIHAVDNAELVGDELAVSQAASELVDVVRGLDEWISGGGALPTQWQKRRSTDRPQGLTAADGNPYLNHRIGGEDTR